MNFSNTKKLSRVLSLLAVLLLMTTLFAGCKKDDTSKDDDPNNGLNLNEGSEPSAVESTPPTTEPIVVNENTGTIISQLNIRSAPSMEGEVVGTMYAGDRVEFSQRHTVGGIQWGYITNIGWICMDYVEMDIPSESQNDTTTTPAGSTSTDETKPNESTGTTTNIKGVVTTALNIRSEANINSDVKGTYNKGDVITILETKDGWGRTTKGWIKMQYVNTSSTTSTTNKDKDKDKDTTSNVNGNGSTTVQFKGITTAASGLNIRDSASTDGKRVGNYDYGTRVEILEKSGNWGRTSKGWISLDYVYQDGTTGKKTASGIVTGNQLNIRSGPGTNYGTVGSLNYGDRVNILEQFTYNGTTWGCTKSGWISLDYVRVDGTDDGNSLDGVITGDQLNIRSGPGTKYNSVGTLNSGDEVTILYQLTVGNITWGNIKQGWISMEYVDLY